MSLDRGQPGELTHKALVSNWGIFYLPNQFTFSRAMISHNCYPSSVRNRIKLLAVATLIAVAASQFSAQAYEKVNLCTAKEKTAVQSHITKQINAISKSDWRRAYNLSAESFRKVVSLESFTSTVKSQYKFLIFSDGFGFGTCEKAKASLNQIVTIDYRGTKRTLSFDLTTEKGRLGVVSANEIVAPHGANA